MVKVCFVATATMQYLPCSSRTMVLRRAADGRCRRGAWKKRRCNQDACTPSASGTSRPLGTGRLAMKQSDIELDALDVLIDRLQQGVSQPGMPGVVDPYTTRLVRELCQLAQRDSPAARLHAGSRKPP